MLKNLMLNTISSQTLARNLLAKFRCFADFVVLPTDVGANVQKTFDSAGQASHALYEAVRSKDDQAVQSILGAAPQLISIRQR